MLTQHLPKIMPFLWRFSLSGLVMFAIMISPGTVRAADLITPNEILNSEILVESGLGHTDLRVIAARLIRTAMGLLGIVVVVVILLGGFTWMTAGGNEEKVAEAKKFIYAGVIGLAIVLSAYAIANFVITQLLYATTAPGPATL